MELLVRHGAVAAGDDDPLALVGANVGNAVEVERGADLEARDGTWDSTPLGWAMVGSGKRPTGDPADDWVETVRTLLDAGASTESDTLSPDDPRPPSPEVAELLRGT